MEAKEYNFDCLILGAGISGMTAAIYLKRANINVAILEKSAPGGQMNMTSKIENYPGYKSIPGPDLSMKIFEQINELEVSYKYGDIKDIIKEDNVITVKTDTEEITTKSVIIATGRSPRTLNIEGEKELTGKGISWCAICDGPFFKGQDVVIIGGGNSAIEEGLYLTNIAKKVTVVHRRNEFRADPVMVEEFLEKENVEILYDSVVTSFIKNDENALGSVIVKNNSTGEEKTIQTAAAFEYVGNLPNTDFAKNLGILDDAGYVVTDRNMRTKVSNIYAAGDVIEKDLYQIVTATGDAASAAMSAIHDMK